MEGYDYILILLLLVAFYWDARFKKIPNWMTAGGAAAGLIYHVIDGGMPGLMESLIGMVAAGGICLFLHLFRAIGAGDVKLFAAIGALAGIPFTLYAMMYSIIYAGLIGIVILLCTRTFIRKMFQTAYELFSAWASRDLKVIDEFQKKQSTRFAFMYAVFPGVLTAYYYFLF